VVVLTVLIADVLTLPAYGRSPYGRSAPAGVIYAHDLGHGQNPSLEYARALNAGYVGADSAEASNFGYAQGSAHHVYDSIHNYVSKSKFFISF
jgi:hypothetical protein